MGFRWLHKIWNIFWTVVGIFVAVSVLLIGIVYGVLQLPTSKNYVATQIEQRVNSGRNAYLSVGGVDGHLPFTISLSDLALYPDSSSLDALLKVDSIRANIDLSGIFTKKLIFPGVQIFNPSLDWNIDETASLIQAFRSKDDGKNVPDSLQTSTGNNEKNEWSVLAPGVKVIDGRFHFDNIRLTNQELLASDSLTFEDFDIDVFIDYSSQQRFIDIEQLSFSIPEANIARINAFGQVFNDARFLEFNAFNIRTANSYLDFSGEIDGVDLLQDNINEQLQTAFFTLDIQELVLQPNNIRKLIPSFPDIPQTFFASTNASGSFDSLAVQELEILLGNSLFNGFGSFRNKSEEVPLRYELTIEELQADSSDLAIWLPQLTPLQLEAVMSTRLRGEVSGGEEQIEWDLTSQNARGSLELVGSMGLNADNPIQLTATLDSLNIGELISPNVRTTNFDGSIAFNTSSLNPKTARGELNVSLFSGAINTFTYDSLLVNSSWADGELIPRFRFASENTMFDGRGTVNLQDTLPKIELSGIGKNVDIKALTEIKDLNEALVDVDYELLFIGNSFDTFFGQITVDIPHAVVGGDTLGSHQIYADYNDPNEANRSLRVTSTAFDLSVNGAFQPQSILGLSTYWVDFFKKRIKQEFYFEEVQALAGLDSVYADQNFQLEFALKEYGLLEQYLPNLPALESKVELLSNINMNANRLLFTASANDQKMVYKDYNADSVALDITGSFRHNELLKSFSGLEIEFSSGAFNTGFIQGEDLKLTFEQNEDSLSFSTNIGRLGEDARFNTQITSELTDSSIVLFLNNFELGSDLYKWNNSGTPQLVYSQTEALMFKDFLFVNDQELLSFEGAFSDQPDDSVNYTLREVNLDRISNLINGRIDFSGTLNGSFTTKSLTRIPTIQGNLGIEALSIDDRVVGDLNISSNFNSELNQFDTRIIVQTDSAKYPQYFTRNEREGQNITLDGYVLAPENGAFPDVDSLFQFNLDFESIDLWVLPFIAPKVFTEMSGIASGEGSVWGNLNNFDYEVNYTIGTNDAVFIRPRFLDTYYYAQGTLSLTRERGLDFEDMFIIDPSGGTAVLSGNYNLGGFGRIHTMDLQLQMDEFHFLNNNFDPDLPFFGDAYGSTTVSMTGTNLNPVLTTLSPVQISDFSNIGIPLLEETKFDEDNKFIRFVTNFETAKQPSQNTSTVQVAGTGNDEIDPFDRTFVERFTLDLQFVAEQPMTVQLIFDPVTGDVIEADGTGRLGIILRNQELSMFGRFDISGGTYQFVSGEIFTRRFELEPGGTIIWEGSPTDARLNLNAIYEARPDINTLTQARADIDSEQSQRVPIELVLNIGGSLNSIENNFYFRLPNTFETRQNSTLTAQINNLNRNEDEKLIQATSFLLMGDFIPSSTASTDATNSLTSNFSGSSAVLNPLLSSQVISPLLSNQVNSLLRSDIGSLDIDFNLNTYNNVDLGVALRLYNDRIILSREGQITGAQSNIGDLGATYRINQTFSVTAFHREDPTFSSIGGGAEESQQAQDINGVGLEAEVSFNSWKEFFNRLGSPFRKLFGKKDDNDELASS